MRRLAVIAMLALTNAADAQNAPPPDILRCNKSFSDKPNPDCANKNHERLNADGSMHDVVPPPRTEDEKADDERKRQEIERVRKEKLAEQRRDANLLNRFPSLAAHDAARKKALDGIQLSITNSRQRQAELEVARKKLADEAEFYVGKPLPPGLKSTTDANQAARDAQTNLVANRQQELERINKLYDEELVHLKVLWDIQKKGSSPNAPDRSPAPAARPAR